MKRDNDTSKRRPTASKSKSAAASAGKAGQRKTRMPPAGMAIRGPEAKKPSQRKPRVKSKPHWRTVKAGKATAVEGPPTRTRRHKIVGQQGAGISAPPRHGTATRMLA